LVPLGDQNINTIVGSIGEETTFQILTSFNNVEKSNNKGEENIKGLDIFQHMPLQQKIHGNSKYASFQHWKVE
jgi:hypothetical protein